MNAPNSSRNTIKIILLGFFFLFFLSIKPKNTYAASVSWDGGASTTNWSDALNWSTDSVPGADDDVLIDTTVTVNIAATTTIKSLTLGNINATTSPTLNFSYDAVNNGALNITNGDLYTYTNSTITHSAANLGAIVGRIKIIITNGGGVISGNINVDGKGYKGGTTNGANGYGPGGGIGYYVQYVNGCGGGAGHAAAGASCNGAGGAKYQTLRYPTDLGSGGGRGCSYPNVTQNGGNGGGNVYISSSGSLEISGNISADATAGGTSSGGGSGGSIYLHGGDLTLSGTISCEGGAAGSGAVAGASGRILIEHTGTLTSTATIDIDGGTGNGTAYIHDLTNNAITIPVNNTIWYSADLDSWSFSSISIQGNITLRPSSASLFQITTTGDVVIGDGVTATLRGTYTNSTDGAGVALDIGGDINIPSTSIVKADSYGYSGGYSTSVPNGFGEGPGLGTGTHGYQDKPGSGAGYGGIGGSSLWNSYFQGGASYGDQTEPMKLGSGGGFGNSYTNFPVGRGGSGGGAIKIEADEITVDGILSANGGTAATIAGAGSGGSLYLICQTLSGSGEIEALGGNGAHSSGGNGGGGRIAIYYSNKDGWSGNSLTAAVATAPGTGGNGGANGTVYLVELNQTPTASATNISSQNSLYDLYPDQSYSFQTIYSDADGASNLDDLYIQIKNPAGTDIEYYATNSETELLAQSPTLVSGSDYISSITYDITPQSPTANDVTVMWHIELDWDWTRGTEIQYGVKATDINSATSTYDYTVSTYLYENRLTFTGTPSATDEYDNIVSTGDWVTPNSIISFTGTKVVFNDTTDIYPNDESFNVQIINDEASVWYDNTSSGENIDIDITTVNGTNMNDEYIFSIEDIPTGGSDISSTSFILKTDSTAPTINSLTSSSHPNNILWYTATNLIASWNISDAQSGVYKVWRFIDQNPTQSTANIMSLGVEDLAISSLDTTIPTNGTWYIHLLAQNNSKLNTYQTYTFKIDNTTPDIVVITGLYNNVWQNYDSGPLISWTDPKSTSDDSFYITNDGTTPSSSNYKYSTNVSSYDLPSQKSGETTIKVRAQNGAGVYSETRSFVIKYDSTAPSNVSNLIATSSIDSVSLSWTNPSSTDLNRVLIQRNGTNIYEGLATTYTDTSLNQNTLYTYKIFSIDNVGNKSSGTTVQTTTLTSSTTPIAPPITEDTKIMNINEIEGEQVKITTDDKDTQTSSGSIHVYTEQTITIGVPASIITSQTDDTKQVLLTISDQTYVMEYDEDEDKYVATIAAPSVKGSYDTTIQTVSHDNVSKLAILMSIKVDPYGYIYAKSGNNEIRISGAKVTLYKMINGVETLWVSDDGTLNPQTTDSTGEYNFFVEPGEYKITVEATGYKDTETEWFKVETNIIEMNIEMESSPYTWYIIAGVGITIISICTFSVIGRRKRRDNI
ncbi:MAG: carboxypeptidase-like regulatory domain-containing protein [Candidatus Dojkabacteria bacterium]|nr:carboxypeptidase-like regulatory domain-containing protein [Candidatus Dojkabacteria bacterium]